MVMIFYFHFLNSAAQTKQPSRSYRSLRGTGCLFRSPGLSCFSVSVVCRAPFKTKILHFFLKVFFFVSVFFFTGTDKTGRKVEAIFIALFNFSPAHKHSDISLQLYIWNGYPLSLITLHYQAASRWDLPPLGFSICLIINWRVILVLIDDIILTYQLIYFWNSVNYHSGIATNEPTI